MKPKEIILKWGDAFNQADADALADLYADDAVNHPVVTLR
jgi:ketosteroid isomerase-like protein